MADNATTAIEHLEALRSDIRDEIKRRIEQRDKYSIQLTIALTAIVAVAFSQAPYRRVIIAAPLVSVYFTVLILYSYRIHSLLAKYLRDRVEPELARLCGTDKKFEWENYYAKRAIPGIRKRFFIVALWVVSVFSLMFLFATESGDFVFTVVLVVVSLVYLGACLAITLGFD